LEQIRIANRDKSEKDANDISIFRHIANSDMPAEERTEERLAKEAQVLLGGGTASTARTIGFASYYILSRPELRSKLEAELREPMANWPQQVPTWAELEQLPLLQAIIKESLRYVGNLGRMGQQEPSVANTHMCVNQAQLWRHAPLAESISRPTTPVQGLGDTDWGEAV
jgi:cytochrome P450